MDRDKGLSIQEHFRDLKDPRIERTKLHALLDIVTIALCAVIAGAETWSGIAEFGRAKRAWLKTFLALPNGIPSADTFRRVLSRLNPHEFQRCCVEWLRTLAEASVGEAPEIKLVHIDGKTARRSFDRAKGGSPLHLVSAWASQQRLFLGQEAVEAESNEITAIPRLLELLELAGAIVTIDAIGCQQEIARQIREAGADYVLALKGNQHSLHERVRDYFDRIEAHEAQGVKFRCHSTFEEGHGRTERRIYLTAPAAASIDPERRWQGLRSVGMVISERTQGGATSIERRYYLSSLPSRPRRFAQAVRRHWSVENALHWSLDVSFREDDSRIREGRGQENFALLRRIALSVLKRDTRTRPGIAIKRQRAGWDNDYLLQLLLGHTSN